MIIKDDGDDDSANSDEVAGMRTCGCAGSNWPYSLRVCDMCVKDDAASLTGRVRHCGICGVVACDEDCGVELVECTDVESWNNAGEFLYCFILVLTGGVCGWDAAEIGAMFCILQVVLQEHESCFMFRRTSHCIANCFIY